MTKNNEKTDQDDAKLLIKNSLRKGSFLLTVSYQCADNMSNV
jgi:hypothetical protein